MGVELEASGDDPRVSDGEPARVLFAGIVAYFLVSRLIPDVFVLPIGVSIRPSQVLLAFVGFLWFYSMIVKPRPLPMGTVGMLATAVLVVIFSAPLLNDSYLNAVQADGVERGGVFAILLAALFLASYYLGHRLELAYRMVVVVFFLGLIQAGFAIYESFTQTYITQAWGSVLSLGFLEFDPGLGRRGFVFGAFRPGGFRPTTTSPHPLVLSSLLGLGVLLSITLFVHAKSWLVRAAVLLAMVLQVYALLLGQTRTGFLVVGVGAMAALALNYRKAPREVIAVALGGIVSISVAVLAAPRSARVLFNLFTRASTDTSVQGRLEDYALVPELLARHPVIGLGYFTHTPQVLLLDNSYLGTLVELGVLGGLLVFAFIITLTVRPVPVAVTDSGKESVVMLSGVLGGLALLLGMATFDALKFAQFMPTVLVLTALAAARVDDRLRRRSRTLSFEIVGSDHHTVAG